MSFLLPYLFPGRLDFVKGMYTCSGCGVAQRQSWQDFLQLGLWPKSLHTNTRTFLDERLLTRIREELLQYRPTGWESRAKVLDAIGARVYNQVGCQQLNTMMVSTTPACKGIA